VKPESLRELDARGPDVRGRLAHLRDERGAAVGVATADRLVVQGAADALPTTRGKHVDVERREVQVVVRGHAHVGVARELSAVVLRQQATADERGWSPGHLDLSFVRR
jgi:hypothetical protein